MPEAEKVRMMICENARRCTNKDCPHKEKHAEWSACRVTALAVDRPGCIQGSRCVEYVEKPETKALIPNPCTNCDGQANVRLWVDTDGRWDGLVECNACHKTMLAHCHGGTDIAKCVESGVSDWNANNPLPAPAPAKCLHCDSASGHVLDYRYKPYLHTYECKNPYCNQRGPRCKTEGESLASCNKQQGQAQ